PIEHAATVALLPPRQLGTQTFPQVGFVSGGVNLTADASSDTRSFLPTPVIEHRKRLSLSHQRRISSPCSKAVTPMRTYVCICLIFHFSRFDYSALAQR